MFTRKDRTPADMRRFIMSGGVLSLSDWQTLTEEQKQAAEVANADNVEFRALHLAYLITPREDLAMAIGAYDGGALYRQLLQAQNQRVLEELEKSEHMANNATDTPPT